MILQILIALGAVIITGSIHFYALRTVAAGLRAHNANAFPAYLAILVTGTLGQCLAAFLFALAYIVSADLGLGLLEAKEPLALSQVFSFSLVNLTTLGLGDVIPSGGLKVLAGIEAMTGFLLISCTASHVFQIMKTELPNSE